MSFSLALAVVCQACEDASIAFAWLLMISSTDGKSEETVSRVIAKKERRGWPSTFTFIYTSTPPPHVGCSEAQKKVGKRGNRYQVRNIIALSCSVSVLHVSRYSTKTSFLKIGSSLQPT